MAVRVLVVEDDLDQHKVIRDILDICLRDAKIDKALNPTGFLNKVRKTKPAYDLILYDLRLFESDGLPTLAAIRSEMPHYTSRLVVLAVSESEVQAHEASRGLAFILKPFSLDSFSEIVKKTCGV